MEGSNLNNIFDSVADNLFGVKKLSYQCGTYTGGHFA